MKQSPTIPSPIDVGKARHVSDLVTPPLTAPGSGSARRIEETLSDRPPSKEETVISPPITPAEAIAHARRSSAANAPGIDTSSTAQEKAELSDIPMLEDIPLPYIQKSLLSMGAQFLNDITTCYAFIRAVSFESLEPSTPPQEHNGGLPIHLEYAVIRAPYIGQILRSPGIEKGDVLDVGMPHPHLWPVALGWIYTGRVRKDIPEAPFRELLEFLHQTSSDSNDDDGDDDNGEHNDAEEEDQDGMESKT